MAKIKKALIGVKQPPVKKKSLTDMQRDEMGKPVSAAEKKKQQSDELKMVDYSGRKSMRRPVSVPKKKMKSGGSFPDLNKDGKVTKKDVLIGRGVLPKTAKKGAALKKQAAVAIAMKKAGKSPKKAMGGMSMSKLANMKKGGKCKYGCK
jgi:hypothetical protein